MCGCRREHGSTGGRAARCNGRIESDAASRSIGLLAQEGSGFGRRRHDVYRSCVVVVERSAVYSSIKTRLALPV